MPICRTCGKVQDDNKMIGRCKFCTGYGKLIDERQYKLEQKNKCNHLIGLHIVEVGKAQGYSLTVFEKDLPTAINNVNYKFKYCPLCGNKTRFYTKENK